jgi:transcriptional regulator with XRE-family HTH domain
MKSRAKAKISLDRKRDSPFVRPAHGLSSIRGLLPLSEYASGISAQYVSNIERGKENPTLDLLLGLADALKVSLGEMCDFEDLDQRKLQNTIREILKIKDPERLRTALRVLRAILH